MTARGLGALLHTLPDTALVPVGWLRAQLDEAEAAPAAGSGPLTPPAPDLTVKQFGACFGRSGSTVRLWCEQGRVEGAWKLNGREWRIPAASVERFRQTQGAPAPDPARLRSGSLSDWRHQRKAG